MASVTSVAFFQPPRKSMSSFLQRLLSDSAAALSYESPLLPTERAAPIWSSRSAEQMDVYRTPPYRPRPGPCHPPRDLLLQPFIPDRASRRTRLPFLRRPIRGRRTLQHSTDRLHTNCSRWISMNSTGTSAAAWGRVHGRNTPTRPSECRSPAANHALHVQDRRSAEHHSSTSPAVSRHRPRPAGPTSATPPDAPRADPQPERSHPSARPAHATQRPSEPHAPAAQTSTSSVAP
ncbi:hypothetical protein C8D87_11168 [Lentzea atacamensis]|uniref:Uncharacterized protein n=1 Tax=Lentzea atacamensis TaxID=531938 RepID=A0ABX9DY90_9PSEU|nr:hypothetical protein C8D87_11168 [Lentzea atacamensis]